MNRILPVRWTIHAVAVAAFALGGCSMFHHKDNYYSKARETRPLEVPPDLDSPPTSDELVVPETGTSTSSSAGTASATTPGGSPPAAAANTGGGLRVADTVDHTWQRVGTALANSGEGDITDRDEAAHSYTFAVNGLRVPAADAPPPAERHWYTAVLHRIEHPLGGGGARGKLLVKVVADGDGSRVDIQGPPGVDYSEAANRVMTALRGNLGKASGEAATGSTPPAAVSVGEGLHFSDSVDHTWQRVGLALERAKLGTITARDETTHSYSLDVEGLRVAAVHHDEQPKEHHWYSAIVDRILYPTGHHNKENADESKPVSGKLLVKVVADGAGARVDVEGAPGTDSSEAARRVLQVLQNRLG